MLTDHWPGAPPSPELESALADLVRRAEAGPHAPVDPARFIGWVGARLGAPDPTAIAAARAADLHLAQACAAGEAAALADFERALAAVRPAIATLGAQPADIDEVLQRLRVQMLVGTPPGIAHYRGSGELRAWLRVVAVREAVRVLTERGHDQLVDDTRLLEAYLPAIDGEHELIRGELVAAFRAAFDEAIRALPARDRLILRQHAVDDLSIDQIGALHAVHRATAARWIEHAHVELARATERALKARLGGTSAEARSLLRQITSRMDASIHRLLAD
ncbi:MAG TPA: sigma factor-like helix-turn-helix DNA-binding protein [Polyangia bacterium]|nr:sigma factor-like helix-turn-helix DNA-binding protein [Polyangia bacterium]